MPHRRKMPHTNVDDQRRVGKQERPDRPEPGPTDEGPDERHEAKGEQDALDKTTRRGER